MSDSAKELTTCQTCPAQQDTAILAETFRLLGDPTRLRILFFCLSQAKSVGDIAQSLALSQTLVSHHLRLLRAARLVSSERQSRQVFYEVADQHVRHILIDMANHIAEETPDNH
ncbi:MAG: ArsR/SmtB family transcription factor [Parahaliea sp.]